MKTLIGLPSMDMVNARFMQDLLRLRIPGDKHYGFATSSLIYDARNAIAKMAIDNQVDRVLWLDSDMTFDPDLFERLNARIDDQHQMVCGLFFSRKAPVVPCIYKELKKVYTDDGGMIPTTVSYMDYPKDSFFQIAGCGLAAVMMTGRLIGEIAEAYGPPFFPKDGFGEDLTFCNLATSLGNKIYCDSSVKIGHISSIIINEDLYLNQNK